MNHLSLVLVTEVRPEGVFFQLSRGEDVLEPGSWPVTDVFLPGEGGAPACPAALLRLLDEGLARPGGNAAGPGILVPHEQVADLPGRELACVGLPPRAPHVLEVSGNGPISAPDFSFRVRFVDPAGIPLPRPARTGAILSTRHGETWVLPLPYLRLLDAIDSYETRKEETDREQHLALIGRVLDLLPGDVRTDHVLRTIHVRWCDTFTLRPYRNRDGEPDFDPVPISTPARTDVEEPEPEPALKGSRQETFARQFRTRPRVFPSYPVGHGWYVVFSPRVARALRVVREYQGREPRERLDFLRNPHAVLRARLEQELPPDQLEGLFVETLEFSERVREIGAWQPPSVPFYTTGIEWLPDTPGPEGEPPTGPPKVEQPAVEVDGTPILRRELAAAREAVAAALEEGRDTARVDGKEIPATREVLRALEAAGETDPAGPPIVLRPRENLEEIDFRERFRRHDSLAPGVPPALRSELFPHQREGLQWLEACWLSGVPGALLADDMGLGKTLQVLSFFAWLRRGLVEAGSAARFLVVGPTALVRNWVAEMDRHFAPETFGEVIPLQGRRLAEFRVQGAAGGKETVGGLPVLDVPRLRQAGIVLCSYEVLRDYQHSLGGIPWTVMALDEAQKIKNPTTLVSSVARAMNAEFVVAITGTPVENRMADLWSILDAIRPGRYGSLREFVKRYEGALDEIRSHLEELGRELASPQPRAPIMMRRLKKDHVEGLPAIEVHRHEAAMPPEQARAYDRVVDAVRREGGPGTGGILGVIQRLRAVSLHPALVDDDLPPDPALSARFRVLLEVLDNVRERGEKALVFVDSRAAQDALVELLSRRYALPHPPSVINGSVPGAARKGRIDEFQARDGFDVMLLSPMAAGVGLNLVAANHVIHLARWWNPAVEDQATDRAYRIGQERDVHVHLPLAIHPEHGEASFDARLNELLERKRGLHQALLAPAAASRQEMADLLDSILGTPPAA